MCIRDRSEGDYVWVVNTDTHQVNRRQVKKGNLLPNGYIIIIEGLQDNETVDVYKRQGKYTLLIINDI